MKLVGTLKAAAVVAALVAAGQASASSFLAIGGAPAFSTRKCLPCQATPPIPEAETWVMMAAGLTMLGVLAHRRVAKKKEFST